MTQPRFAGMGILGVATILLLPLASQAKEPSAQCIAASRQCKTATSVGQSSTNDARCGRMLRFCQETGSPMPLAYSDFGLKVIDRAIRLFTAKNHMSTGKFKDNFATALVDLPNMICVSMIPFMATGGGTTICLDKAGEKPVLEYESR